MGEVISLHELFAHSSSTYLALRGFSRLPATADGLRPSAPSQDTRQRSPVRPRGRVVGGRPSARAAPGLPIAPDGGPATPCPLDRFVHATAGVARRRCSRSARLRRRRPDRFAGDQQTAAPLRPSGGRGLAPDPAQGAHPPPSFPLHGRRFASAERFVPLLRAGALSLPRHPHLPRRQDAQNHAVLPPRCASAGCTARGPHAHCVCSRSTQQARCNGEMQHVFTLYFNPVTTPRGVSTTIWPQRATSAASVMTIGNVSHAYFLPLASHLAAQPKREVIPPTEVSPTGASQTPLPEWTGCTRGTYS